MPVELLLERAYHWERTCGGDEFLNQPIGESRRMWTWTQAMHEARHMAGFLKSQGWPPGSRIVILSGNCAWWVMADLAVWMAGHASVPIYASSTVDSGRRLMLHCEPAACFIGPTETPGLAQAIPASALCIRFPNAGPVACDGAIDWDSAIAEGRPIEGDPVRPAGDLATIIYTSGTTGNPKGVMHCFGAISHCVDAVMQFTGRHGRERLFSYLPLAHIAERALTEATAIRENAVTSFCDGMQTFLRDLEAARPTVFFSVPRLYAKFQQKVWEKMPQSRLEMLLHVPLAGDLVRKEIIRHLGLSTVRLAASGSAAMPMDLLLWWRHLGLPLAEGYGTTEAGITHTAPNGEFRAGYVGCGGPGVETRIAPNGELLIKSPMNMLGYYKDPDLTRETFTEDGFIKTGDLGELDAEGWLKINGRIKEQFKTSKGKYVLPSGIEAILERHPAVEACLVLGADWPAPCAAIVLTPLARKNAATEHGRNALEHSLQQMLDSANAKLEDYERLKLVAIVDGGWTMERGFLTPTMKMKRPVLEAYYRPRVAEWMARNKPVVWDSEIPDHSTISGPAGANSTD
ncbi:MAG TPA: AMP-binding protein [Bryobacteraceae bacterium]|jgi:long-chain acyl-CoA synthetase|nr:AMP-binding protein [Bryobacteraceae bacterium]